MAFSRRDFIGATAASLLTDHSTYLDCRSRASPAQARIA
jgi:hypothetical protein